MKTTGPDSIFDQSMNLRTQTELNTTGNSEGKAERYLWLAFLATLALFVLGFSFPEQRLWGMSQWAYFPWPYAAAVFILTALFALLAGWILRRTAAMDQPRALSSHYMYFGLALVLVLGAAFYLLRARIHFLGDGYTLLANLASDEPIVKWRNLGETLARQFVYSLLEGDNSWRSLTAYQVVSISGGLFFTTTVVICARFLFEAARDRVLFSLGVLSGGYMLLFFGYAEHYSLFVPVVGLFALVGLLVTLGRLHRLWILVPVGLAVFLHIFGFILIPAALYLLLQGTRVQSSWGRFALWVRAAVGLAVMAGIVVPFYYYYTSSFFFRFSLVPVIQDQFTLEGYTMFSLKHLADVANLLIMLFPGLLVAAASIVSAGPGKRRFGHDYMFLLVLLVTSIVVVFVIDPNLGMPRDWDLFAFSGISVVVSGFYMILRLSSGARTATLAALLAILLGFMSLIPRVISQVVPKLCLAQVYDYARLDLKRNLFFLQQLHQYYWDHGQSERSPLMSFDYDEQFPEYGLLLAALELKKQGNCVDAVPILKRAITLNPTMVPPYSNLGSCYLDLGFPDSALLPLRIADGLSPHRILTILDLGQAYLRTGSLEKARRCFERALEINSDFIPARVRLLELYSLTLERHNYVGLLLETAAMPNAPASVNKELGDYYVEVLQFDRAREEYLLAIRKGLPEDDVREILETFPDLSP